MQNSYEKFGKHSDVLDTDFSNWEDDDFCENSQLSDAENIFVSKNLIKCLESTTNKISNQTDGSHFCKDEILRRGVVEDLSFKDIKSSKFGKINASWNYIPQKEHKQTNISSLKKNKSKAGKHVHESSDSDDFCSPNKKYKRSKTCAKNIFLNSEKDLTKQSFAIYSPKTYTENYSDPIKEIQNLGTLNSQGEIMTASNQEFPDNPNAAVSSQGSCSSKMITSSQEVSAIHDVTAESQKFSIKQKMGVSRQDFSTSETMITSSQKKFGIQNTSSNLEFCSSPKITTSSQESSSSKMITSSQEALAIQNISAESQEFSIRQKMGVTRQNFLTSETMITLSQENLGIQNTSSSLEFCRSPKITSSQESSSSKMITSSQESLAIQNMSEESQEFSIRQKMGVTRQNFSTSQTMITSSQENSGSQNISFSPEFCNSPKIITSSQESLGKQVMGIYIEEDPNILTDPHTKKSHCRQYNILNQGAVNLDTLSAYNNQQRSANGAVSNKKVKIDFSDKDKLAENFTSMISDSFCKKTDRRYNKSGRRLIWCIRKRELEVTKRENAVEIREKLLDTQEADIKKREQVLKLREQRYLRLKASMKKLTKRSNFITKTSEEKIKCLRR